MNRVTVPLLGYCYGNKYLGSGNGTALVYDIHTYTYNTCSRKIKAGPNCCTDLIGLILVKNT
jgi:hypothetical protein